MKIIRASKKIDKAIDALIDLQQDYNDEMMKAEVGYDVQTTLDTLNRIRNQIDALEN